MEINSCNSSQGIIQFKVCQVLKKNKQTTLPIWCVTIQDIAIYEISIEYLHLLQKKVRKTHCSYLLMNLIQLKKVKQIDL
jgi:hypothetical protein